MRDTPTHTLPLIIQGGMGVGVSNWRLAAAVSRLGQLGVVSGTALDQILARRLQDGDPGGDMRRALDRFPMPSIAERIWDRYFISGGKSSRQPYKTLPLHGQMSREDLQELCVVSNFVEVTLAREGHDHPVGINYLEKIQLPHLPSLYGAMLAGVDYVLMGAGIPLRIPGVLDRLSRHESVSYQLTVTGASAGDDTEVRFTPSAVTGPGLAALKRPQFIAIVASDVLATTLVRRSNGRVNGFVVEGPTAGGHNAPPRGKPPLSPDGEPVYGPRDQVDLSKIRELGLPFWLAGGYGTAAALRHALRQGATGVQVGTAFALCRESGLRNDYRAGLLAQVRAGSTHVFTDPRASPTGFPFKVASFGGSISDDALYQARPRICDLGYLREMYRTAEGTIGFRCPAEPLSLYVSKGGDRENAEGRKCICNGLMANVGHAQLRGTSYVERGLLTAGDDLPNVSRFLKPGARSYSAADVVATLLDGER